MTIFCADARCLCEALEKLPVFELSEKERSLLWEALAEIKDMSRQEQAVRGRK
jgi:hypothetical protein